MSRVKILQYDWCCRNSCNREQLAYRQCIYKAFSRARIEKAWLREASINITSGPRDHKSGGLNLIIIHDIIIHYVIIVT